MKSVKQVKIITEIVNVHCDECGKPMEFDEDDEEYDKKHKCFLCEKYLCQDCRLDGSFKEHFYFRLKPAIEHDIVTCEDCTKIYFDEYIQKIEAAHEQVEQLFVDLKNECIETRWEKDNP
jgi:hypothetical protein